MVVKWVVLSEILRIKRELVFCPLRSLLRRFRDENHEKDKKWHMHNSIHATRKVSQTRETNYFCSSAVTCLYSQFPYWHGFAPLPEIKFQVFIRR